MSVRARRQREKEKRRQDILDAAERVFLLRGAHATMEDIASEAQIAKGTVYLYFSGKDELYLVLIGKALDILRLRLEAVAAQPAPVEVQIRGFIDAYAGFFRDHTDLFQLLDRSGYPVIHSEVSPDVLELTYGKSDAVLALITGVLQRGIDDGILRNDVPAFELAIILWNNANGILRMIDGLMASNIWAGRRDRYAIRTEDLYRLLETSGSLLLDAVLHRPADNTTESGHGPHE